LAGIPVISLPEDPRLGEAGKTTYFFGSNPPLKQIFRSVFVNDPWLKRMGGILSALLTAFIPMSLSDCNGGGATGPASGSGSASRIREQEILNPSGSRIYLMLYDYSGAKGSVKIVGYVVPDMVSDSSIDSANTSGNITKSLWYSGDGSFKTHTDFTYDANQTLIADTTYSDANDRISYQTYGFTNGRKTRNDYYGSTGHSSYVTYEYDAAGTRIKSVTHDSTGNMTNYTTYTYSDGLLDTLRSYDSMDEVTLIRTFKMERQPAPYDYMKFGNF
jgi:hypothetical protein